jgi:hypothetical protein
MQISANILAEGNASLIFSEIRHLFSAFSHVAPQPPERMPLHFHVDIFS